MKTNYSSLALRTVLLGTLFLGGLLRFASSRVVQGPEEWWRANDWEYYGGGAQIADAGQFRPYPGFPPTAFRMPLYPALLAAVRKVRPGMATVRAAQAGLDLLALAGACLVAWILGGPWTAAGTAVLGAFADTPIQQLSLPQIETFYGFLIVSVLAAIIHWSGRVESLKRAALAGGLVGVSLLCRSVLLLFPLLVAIGCAVAAARQRKPAALAAGIFLACSYLPLAPWIARNAVLFHRTVLVEDGAAALNLWGASVGMLENPTMAALAASGAHAPLLIELQRLPDARRGQRLFELARGNISANPELFLGTSLRRLPLLWREQGWLWLLAAGALFLRSRNAAGGWALCLAGYFNIYVFMGVQPRYARPIFYVMCALASWGAWTALQRWRPCAREDDAVARLVLRRFVRAAGAFALLAAVGVSAVLAREMARGRSTGVPSEYRQRPERYAPLKSIQAEGIDLVLKGRWSEAGERFSLILREEPCFGEALLSRALVWDWMGQRTPAAGDYRQALRCLERVDGGDPRLAEF